MGIAAAVYRNDFEMALKEVLKQSLVKYNDNKSDKIAWNNVQTQVQFFTLYLKKIRNTKPIKVFVAYL